MKVFGPKPWGPALESFERSPEGGLSMIPGSSMVPTPVGEPCLYCGEVIAVDDSGVIMAFIDAEGTREVVEHRECFLRHVLGSVGHQRQRCACYGGNEEDPPGLSKREAAKAAVAFAFGKQGL